MALSRCCERTSIFARSRRHALLRYPPVIGFEVSFSKAHCLAISIISPIGPIRRISFALAILVPGAALASDWPQWRGPNRNGISAETTWTYRWPATGPRKAWSVQVGEGWSSVAVVGG